MARRDFRPSYFARESFFVPDDVEGNDYKDDGYLVCYVHNERTSENQFVVMDARSLRWTSSPRWSYPLLGILNTNRKIRKRRDTHVAFTRLYSRVSIFHRERECTN